MHNHQAVITNAKWVRVLGLFLYPVRSNCKENAKFHDAHLAAARQRSILSPRRISDSTFGLNDFSYFQAPKQVWRPIHQNKENNNFERCNLRLGENETLDLKEQ